MILSTSLLVFILGCIVLICDEKNLSYVSFGVVVKNEFTMFKLCTHKS